MWEVGSGGRRLEGAGLWEVGGAGLWEGLE